MLFFLLLPPPSNPWASWCFFPLSQMQARSSLAFLGFHALKEVHILELNGMKDVTLKQCKTINCNSLFAPFQALCGPISPPPTA